MTDRVTVFVSGRAYWAKIVGEKALVSNYEGDGREWTVEFAPDDVSFLKEHKLLDRLKDKEDAKNPNKGKYLILRKSEFTKDGEKNEPFRIYDGQADRREDGKLVEWDDRLIGNGSAVDAKLSIVDWGKGKKKSIYLQALRVTDLVSYGGGNEFAGMDGEAASAPKPSNPSNVKTEKTVLEELDELEDDLPF